ncbi:DSS1/SEM1 [Dillenia turbinata]|uniref:26S proteasome complex subunit SEM1 n=1 Tax=Dillenia turbinata TaxID=194707 RepID=A0AAN8VIM2_9MAGN
MEKETKVATEDPKVDLFEDDDEFEEFEINEDWDDKEGKETTQQWEDDWDDDDVNDDFSLQLKKELESSLMEIREVNVSGAKRDREGSLSVLSMPGETPGMLDGKGTSMMMAVVPEREFEMKGRLAGVVKMVTATCWRRRRCARSITGTVWPLDMNGKSTICRGRGFDESMCE